MTLILRKKDRFLSFIGINASANRIIIWVAEFTVYQLE